MNITSTAMGSNATYQCRDGSSDVYTTQCTSDGVWEPNPNSTLDCTKPGIIKFTIHYSNLFIYRIILVLCKTPQSTAAVDCGGFVYEVATLYFALLSSLA